MRLGGGSLASLSGLRMPRRLQMGLGSSVAMAAALIRPLARELPYATGVDLKRKKIVASIPGGWGGGVGGTGGVEGGGCQECLSPAWLAGGARLFSRGISFSLLRGWAWEGQGYLCLPLTPADSDCLLQRSEH